MTSGILVNKETRKKVLGFKDIENYSAEEIIERNGLNPDELEFVDNKDLDIDVMEIRGWHKINSDGSVEDAREIVGYRAILEDIIEVKGKQFSKDTKIFKVDDKEQAEELAQKLNMEITDFEEIKKLPKT